MTAVLNAPGDVPAALVPVRLETRFTAGQPRVLQIRVYPTELHADGHDRRLTALEAEGGAAFWAVPATAETERREAWGRLVARHGVNRAAWIVRESAAPANGSRAAVWDRAVQAAALPDRWIARGYRDGAKVVEAQGSAIRPVLALGPAPCSAPAAGELVDEGLAWAVDWESAKAAGMALEITDCPALDRLVVFGIRATDGAGGASLLAGLLDAHRYGEGLELIAQGTPTNNTQQARSGFTGADSAADVYDRLFKTPQPPPDETDGGRLAGALGLPPGQFDRLAGSTRTESQEAQAMNAALWPTTWGHTLDLVHDDVVPPAAVEVLRRHFIDWVRARGPLAALRIGRQAVGVLPVLSPARAVGPQDDPALRGLASVLERTRQAFLDAGRAHAAGATEALLARCEVSQADAARAVFTPVDDAGWFKPAQKFMDRPRREIRRLRAAEAARVAECGRLLGAPRDLDWPQWVLLPEPEAAAAGWAVTGAAGRRPRVEGRDEPASSALEWLARARRADLEGDAARAPRDSLLYLLARSALLRVLVDRPPPNGAQPARGRLDGKPEPSPATALAETYAGVRRLTQIGSAERLERLLAETLDLAAHRWDAAVTSLATRRLALLRRGGSSGVIVGAYGWMENLAAADPPAATARHPFENVALPLADEQSSWALAPSLAQAVTCAVLWSGQLRHRRDALSAPVDVDLSSRRVRLAQSVLSAVQAGHRLGAVLGYRFERALQGVAGEYIAPFRRLAPLELPAGSADSRDVTAAATDVVDGLALLRRFDGPNAIPWDTGGMPPENDEVKKALADLRYTMDAVADALLAEGVHQTLQGRTDRSSASLAAAARGELTGGELEFARTPRTGRSVSHRIIVLAPTGAPSGWPLTPRAQADRSLNRWAATVLGAPSDTAGAVELVDPAKGTVVAGSSRTVTFADLKLAPLDLLAAAVRPGDFERYLTHWLRASGRWPQNAPAGAEARLGPRAAPAAGKRTLVDGLALAAAAARVTGLARALDGRDLGAGGPAVDLAALATRVDEARKRVATAAERLRAARSAQDAAKLRQALAGAWFLGVRDVLPRDGAPLPELLQQATGAITELERRVAASLAGIDPGEDDPAGALRVRLDRLELLHGEGFRALPSLALPDPELARRAAAGTAVEPVAEAQAPAAWLARLARVRKPVQALETLGSLSEALGTGQSLRVHPAQLPIPPAGKTLRWVGLPPRGTPTPATTSLVFVGAAPPAAPPAGMVVDTVDETIPASTETAGVTFRHNAPSAQAPQAILLAVPPVGHGAQWQVEEVEAAVLQAADLAQARLADVADLGALRALLPAVHLPGPGAPAVQRLIAPPPKFAVVEVAPPPVFTVSPASVRQGQQVKVTVAGTGLTADTEYSVSGGGVTVRADRRTATGAELTVSAAADAAVDGQPLARRLLATVEGAVGDAAFAVTAAPYVGSVAPDHVSQLVGKKGHVRVTVAGTALPTITAASVTGSPFPVPALVESTSAEEAVVQFEIKAADRPSTDWNPNDPTGPRKPPLPPAIEYTEVPMTLRLASDLPPIELPLVLEIVSFVVQER